MSTLTYTLRDSTTMLRRDIRHSLRYLPMTLSGVGTPAIMLALFNYFFGGTIGAGIDGAAHARRGLH
jgi:ABC-2 type transport system permease protein